MCTVIIHVPERQGAAVHLLAVRDEDPQRAWMPLGESWPERPGIVGVRDGRAGGAWLAADPAARRLAVILNRADVLSDDPPGSRGHVVLDALAGREPPAAPRTHGFNLVEVDADGARVTMWDGRSVRRAALAPGIHMIAHDDVDDERTARIAAWHDRFSVPDDGDARWWRPWLDVLERASADGATDDRAIVRDNRPFGYPTLSLLVCAASVDAAGVRLSSAAFDQPGRWNRPELV